ncbi:MAG: ice-binding family protein [Actinomycetota bacterium]|nr:ice-binding family protein [Actinomycetota bacterium]
MNAQSTFKFRLAVVGTAIASMPLMLGGVAHADLVASVPLGVSSGYSVLAAETITNDGTSTFASSIGLSPGTSITGILPVAVAPPGTIDAANTAAANGQLALTTAYLNAAGRTPTEVTANLTGLTLQGGVYSGPSRSSLMLPGTLTLDANGNEDTVFIFVTDSTLTTGSGSSINLINGAQQCRVFWQVGSSATLGSGSVMVGNVLAQASVTLDAGVTVYGRVMARTGSVTLISDTFVNPTCASAAVIGGIATTTPAGVVGTNPDGTPVITPAGSTSSGTVWLALGLLATGIAVVRLAVRRPSSI